MEFKTSRRNQGNRKRIYKIGHRDNGIFSNVCTTKEEKCLVIGGGKIALRKIEVLKDFESDITVIAPEMITQIRQIDQICRIFRTFMEKDFNEADFVIAATDDQKQIMRSARSADERRFLSMRSIRKKIAALFFHPM